jgi:hypothetical protein
VIAIGAITLSVEGTVWMVTGVLIKGSATSECESTFLSAFQDTLYEV